MEVEPIHQTDLSFRVYQRIKELILNGTLSPGEKILQEKIAAQLGVSRMPLHKAFVMLEDEFLVESIPRRGIFVAKPDIQAIIDAFECREGLEGIAARRASENLTDHEIDVLEALFSEALAGNEMNHANYQQADRTFHEAIIKASGNNVMRKLNSVGSVLIRTYPKGIILPLEESMADHREILQAFRDRDAEKAELLIRNHSRKAIRILQKELEKKDDTVF
ncbi:MAG: GntR family transcriptional regulator [Bacteroidales bacterium]|nr:GntR family transcriptional regulator [Bacteroidales bacterium]MDT8431974.1 GntR family transcriptional regulator [Bacteroidales bacterium]